MSESEVRHIPSSMREYLQEFGKIVRMIRWAFGLADSPEVRPFLYRRYLFLFLVVSIGMALPGILSHVFAGALERNVSTVLYASAVFGACFITQQICKYCLWCAHEQAFGRALGSINKKLTALFFEKSPGQHKELKGLNHESMVKGKQRTFTMYMELVPELFEVSVSVIVAYVLLWFISPVVGVVMTVVAGGYLAWSLYLNYRVAVVCTDIEREFSAFERYVVSRWKFVERVIVSAKKQDELDEIESRWDHIIERDRSFWLWHAKQAAYRDIKSSIAYISIIFYGGYLVATGAWTELGILYPLYAWTSRVMDNIWRIGHVERRMSECIPSMNLMQETLLVPPDVYDLPESVDLPEELPVELCFENVGYHYPSGNEQNQTIRGVNFSVAPGTTAALVGPSGGGKSTLLSLLMRFMNPTEGRILVAGKPIDKWRLQSWYSSIAYIPQKAQIFDGTVRDNLLYALSKKERSQWSDERLLKLMSKLAIDFGRRPAGENPLDIVVGRDGVQLSGGQAQRLAIGAAVVKRPRFMFVDEATSHLDSTTEKAVLEGLDEFVSGVGMLVIAHRLSTVRAANKIIVLRDGEVEAQADSFASLYENSSTFRQLAHDQDLVVH